MREPTRAYQHDQSSPEPPERHVPRPVGITTTPKPLRSKTQRGSARVRPAPADAEGPYQPCILRVEHVRTLVCYDATGRVRNERAPYGTEAYTRAQSGKFEPASGGGARDDRQLSVRQLHAFRQRRIKAVQRTRRQSFTLSAKMV
jgi:hypothetical protein